MKISIQLRKFGKSGQAKVYYRLRDGKTDMKAASSMSIQPEFWDNVNHCYKKNTPTDIVSEEVQKRFNERVALVLKNLVERYEEGADFLWLTSIIKKYESIEPEPVQPVKTAEEPKKPIGKSKKTMLEYFQIYLETSHFNDWHYQSQVVVMNKLARF